MKNTDAVFSKDGIPHIRVAITLPIHQDGRDTSTDWLLTRLSRAVGDHGGEMSEWRTAFESHRTT